MSKISVLVNPAHSVLLEAMKGYDPVAGQADYWPVLEMPGSGEAREAKLREILLSARREGISFRFWYAVQQQDNPNLVSIMISSKKGCDELDKFDDVLDHLGYLPPVLK